ncbi:hypothetical protein P280DRAFT_544943 [Massarina eburnea CBS 473.64]|uniref:Transcription factor tfiiic complex a box associated subunit sfc1 n=1 Tax=Massarina eburnea CBS 473.64 TaxID=1395130 RepID=A0A6A6SI40_9PLEO|nr:hypothetical protein P280DRAFT_544943 [Massarina eburnea CBS 473.64]
MDMTTDGGQTAPWLQIPSRAISVVEHPCMVKSVEKGIASLGGAIKLSKGLRSKLDVQPVEDGSGQIPHIISASLRPDDPLAKRLLSTPVTTNNLLLKVTVPKRTGRKRKRGSSGPFLSEEEEAATDSAASQNHAHVEAPSILRRLQDNATKYTVSVAGLIDETHRFRDLPDLQYAASTSASMTSIRDNIVPFNYGKLMQYDFGKAAGADLATDVGPSAEFIQMPVAYNYKFQQNAYVKYTADNGGEVNLQRSFVHGGYIIIKVADDSVPQGRKSDLPDETELSPYLQSLIANIRSELELRPIITRHLLYNRLGWDKRDKLRQAAIYCGYFFESGPWREALIKWGVDPRKDARYRKYQTVSFLSYRKSGPRHFTKFDEHVASLTRTDPVKLANQHKFDGKHVSDTGNLFQFCDITDPIIRRILDTDDIRSTCAPTAQGWYHGGTWAKATIILKDKMNRILLAENVDDSIYQRIVTWPELWDDKEIYALYKAEHFDKQVHKEKIKEHTVMNSVRWAAKNPRYAFEQMEAAKARADAQDEEEDEGDAEVEVPEDLTEEPETAATILEEATDEDAEGETDGEYESDEAAVGEEEEEDDDDDGLLEPRENDSELVTSTVDGPGPFGGLFSR